MQPFVSIIIPAFNETKWIAATLDGLCSFLVNDFPESELILVDDGSTDNTSEVIESWLKKSHSIPLIVLKNEKNLGKGYSVRRGMLFAKGTFRIFIDADLPFDLKAIHSMVHAYKSGEKIVIGNRNDPNSSIPEIRFARRAAGYFYALLVQILLKDPISDTQCGLKGFSADAAQTIFSRTRINGFGFDVETLYLAQKKGFHPYRIPVRMKENRPESRVHLVKDSMKMFVNLFSVIWNDLCGYYN